MVSVILLSVAYLLGAVALGSVCVAVGMLPVSALRGLGFGRGVSLVMAFALGSSIVSALVAWFGLVGLLSLKALVPGVAVLAVVGVWAGGRGFRHQSETVMPPLVSRPMRALVCIAALWAAVMALNVLVGGLHPDISLDPAWYHLTVPAQWVATGRLGAYPLVMPSNYPLAGEALFAVCLLVSDAVLCSTFYALTSVVLLAGMVLVSLEWTTSWSAFVVAVALATFTAAVCAVAPMLSLNDNIAALPLFCAVIVLLQPLRKPDVRLNRYAVLCVGWLLGFAAATKLTTLGFIGPISLVFIIHGLLVKSSPYRGRSFFLHLVLGGAAAYLPWAIRGILHSGNPFFPLFAGIFGARPPYDLALATSRRLNGLHTLNAQGLSVAVTEASGKLSMALTSSDAMFGLCIIFVAAGLLARRNLVRLSALVVAVCMPAFLVMRGGSEVPRYFAICYPLATPGLVVAIEAILQRLRPRQATWLLGVLLIGSLFTYGNRQMLNAEFETMRWHFRPVVTEEQRVRFAYEWLDQVNYPAMRALQPCLPREATVFLPDITHPIYLQRAALWSDGVVVDMQDYAWKNRTPQEFCSYLADSGVTHILVSEPANHARYEQLVGPGMLSRIDLQSTGALAGYRLYKLSGQAPAERSSSTSLSTPERAAKAR